MVGKVNLKDPRFRYETKGFTSIVNQIIDLCKLHYSLHKNYDVFIEDDQVLKIFDPINKTPDLSESYNVSDIFFNLLESGNYDTTFNAHTIANVEDLKSRNLNSYLKIKNDHLEKYNLVKKELFQNYKVLGIQIRGTDKSKELPKIPIEKIFHEIDLQLNESPVDKIFVATDDIEYLNSLLTRYGENIIIYNKSNIYSTDGLPIHGRYEKERVNYEVMMDVFLLSQCDYFLYCFSNVSFLALILMDDYTKKIKNINL